MSLIPVRSHFAFAVGQRASLTVTLSRLGTIRQVPNQAANHRQADQDHGTAHIADGEGPEIEAILSSPVSNVEDLGAALRGQAHETRDVRTASTA
jgi:hypothetical protein